MKVCVVNFPKGYLIQILKEVKRDSLLYAIKSFPQVPWKSIPFVSFFVFFSIATTPLEVARSNFSGESTKCQVKVPLVIFKNPPTDFQTPSSIYLLVLCQIDEHGDQIWLEVLHLDHLGELAQLSRRRPTNHRGVILAQVAELAAELGCKKGKRRGKKAEAKDFINKTSRVIISSASSI